MKTISLPILLLIFTGLTISCSKSEDPTPEPEPEPDFEQLNEYTKKWKNGVFEVNGFPIDSAKFPDTPYDWEMFFDLKKATFIPKADATADNWDLYFNTFTLGEVTANNGEYIRDWYDDTHPAYTSNRKLEMSPVLESFFELTSVPQNTDFKTYNPLMVSTNIDDKFPQNWAQTISDEIGRFSYLKPHTNRSYIYKLDNGQYVKFQMINVYNNPPEENNTKSKRGYLSFRYYIADDGSTDLTTPKI